MMYLPEELISKVLSKLPVKSLLRFRCVSKLWLNLIDCPSFINLHLKHTEQNFNNIMFIGRNNVDKHHLYGPNSIYTLDFDIVGKAKAKAKAEARYLELPHVLDRGISMTTCNGLICYALSDRIVICNPATHNYRHVPLVSRGTSPYEFGFGYDYSTDDYKVVALEPRGGGGGGEEEKYYVYQVYSMKSDTWGIRRRKNGIWSNIRTPVYAGGSLYWVDSNTDDAWNAKYRVIAYDLVRDKWRIQLVPEPIRKSGYMHLSNHRGSLCVSCVKSFTTHLEFWLLENHQGIKYSWSKLFLMKETQRSMAIDIIAPMGNLKRKRGVLFNDCDVVKWYDFKKRKTEVIDIVCEANVLNMFTCYESLVRV